MHRLYEKVHFINEEIVSVENRRAAFDLCNGVDVNDTPIIALALQLNAPVWTGDKKLIEGLSKKGYTKFV